LSKKRRKKRSFILTRRLVLVQMQDGRETGRAKEYFFLFACLLLLVPSLKYIFFPSPFLSFLATKHRVEILQNDDTPYVGFLPSTTQAWVNLSDIDNNSVASCGVSSRLGNVQPPHKEISFPQSPLLLTVSIPRVHPSNLNSYGNVFTCRGGYRLHAYLGVNHSFGGWFNVKREVVLNRGQEEIEQAGFPIDSGLSLSLDDASLVEGIRKISRCCHPSGERIDEGVVFFDIDTDTDAAFIHWLAESAVFLEYWDDLLAMHPGIRLLLRQRRGYKLSFAEEFYGITRDRIVFKDESPEIVALGGAPNAITYFPPFLTLFDSDAPDIPFFEALWQRFISRMRKTAGVDTPPPWLPTRALILARGHKENNKANDDRVHSISDALAALWQKDPTLPSQIVPLELAEYDTYPSVVEQVIMQSEAKVFTVAYGSALFLNAALARNASVLIENPNHWTHHIGFPYLTHIYNFAEKFNKLTELRGISDVNQVIGMFDAALMKAGPMAMEAGG